jgi:hypothetical protein
MFAALRFPGGELKALADERAAAARQLPMASLRSLPRCQDETLERHGVAVTVTTYRDDVAGGGIRVVVVATVMRTRVLAWGTSAAAGFAVDAEGGVRELSDEDWLEYS